ncbi:capsid protein [Miresoil virus 103]|uniref:Capsid protein n=1 Tax=Miresoil virus 103 TaxID=2911451 RepID=A0A9E8YYU2_9VIRU|nr:capsid protein [Miresoil virus 103]
MTKNHTHVVAIPKHDHNLRSMVKHSAKGGHGGHDKMFEHFAEKIVQKLESHAHAGTQTEEKEKLKGDDVHSGVVSESYTVHVHKPPKSVVHGGGPIYYHENLGFRTVSAAGKQAAFTIAACATTSQLLVASSSAGVHQSYQSAMAYFDVNPNRGLTGSNQLALTSALKLNPAADRILLSHLQLNFEFSNFGSTACVADIYVVQNKNNTLDDAVSIWNRMLTTSGNGLAVYTNPSAGIATGSAFGFADAGFVGARPNQCKAFKTYFKILKVHHINLASAATEIFNLNVKLNYLAKMPDVIQANSASGMTADSTTWTVGNIGAQHLKGGIQVFIVQRGIVADDVTTTSITTVAPSQIGILCAKRILFKMVAAQSARITQDVNFTDLPTGAINSNIKSLNAVDGVVGYGFAQYKLHRSIFRRCVPLQRAKRA